MSCGSCELTPVTALRPSLGAGRCAPRCAPALAYV